MKAYRFHREARTELRDAIAYWNERSPGYGDRLRDAVEATLRIVRQNPNIGTPKPAPFRVRRVVGFQYLVVYVDLPAHIWVVAVMHASRAPNYWATRQPEDAADPEDEA